MTETEPVLVVSPIVDGVLELRLNRPDSMNALNLELKSALAEAIRAAEVNEQVRAVLLTGSGRAFCAGGDLSEMDPGRSPETARVRQEALLSQVFIPLARLAKPVVAAVHSHAHGAGLSLALACDVVVVAEDAPLSLGYVLRGLTPDCGTTYFLPRLLGMARVKDLLFSGRRFTGADAEAMGLVAVSVAAGQVADVARERARELAGLPTVALVLAKRMLDQSSHLSLEDLANVEAYSQAITRSTDDHKEAIEAFHAKRPAVFSGR